MSHPVSGAANAPPRDGLDSTAPDPLSRLRAEHGLLLEWARHVEFALSHRTLDEEGRASLEENMRALRALLPRHLVGEERSLYAELESAEPSSAPLLGAIRLKHLGLEQAFGSLQGLALARAVDLEGGRAQRKALTAARDFREKLETLIAAKEEGPFALAARALSPEAMARVEEALEAAALRDQIRRLQGR